MRKQYSRRSIVILTLIVIVGVGLLWQRQAIHDYIATYNYHPPTAVSQLADQTTMTASARRIFYVNHPAVEDRSAFNGDCGSRGEHTIILGCYKPVDRGIYVFAVNDDRLAGVEQVTAAHELLHAGYDRLNSSDKQRVNAMLLDFYTNKLTDQRIKAVIDVYKQTEPNDVVNEMHSVFGTEVVTLPASLEAYYKRYFTDRSVVTDYAVAYQTEFSSRQARVDAYDTELIGLKKQIDDASAQLDVQEAQIRSSRNQLDALRSAGDTTGYNAGVPGYNTRIETYNQLVDTTQALVGRYNAEVKTRNALAVEVTDLAHSIDSSFQPIQ